MTHNKSMFVFAVLILTLNASVIAAHIFGAIVFKRWIFLWFIGGLSDLVASIVALTNSWRHRHRNPFTYYYCMLLGAIALETTCVLIANLNPPVITDYGVWYTCWFWSGRWARSFAVWMMVLFQVGYLNGWNHY